MHNFQFADIHCHPNLKTYGHSFNVSSAPDPRTDLWYHQPLTPGRRLVKNITGISAYSQADFSAMCAGNVKLAFVSLYPFEKGFFINLTGGGGISAFTADIVTGIGYHRVRHLQQHLDYFQDLEREYQFFQNGLHQGQVNGQEWSWTMVSSSQDLEELLTTQNKMGVVLSIEGAHVFNTGLRNYGRLTDPEEVRERIRTIKQWAHPPVFITFAHNFYNELCGHARSLETLGPLVNQREGLNDGFTELGIHTLDELISHSNGAPILIDIKHMSLKARQQYFEFRRTEYYSLRWLPVIVSHGGVTGLKLDGGTTIAGAEKLFYQADINFFDEEVVEVARSGGLFAIQLDKRRLASRAFLQQAPMLASKYKVSAGAVLVWAQIQHMVEVLDHHRLPAWEMISIGSDFDGTINPPEGCYSSMDYSNLGLDLLKLAGNYLLGRRGTWNFPENGLVDPGTILHKFSSGNAIAFLDRYFRTYKSLP